MKLLPWKARVVKDEWIAAPFLLAEFLTNILLPLKSTSLSLTEIAPPSNSTVLFMKELFPPMSALLPFMYICQITIEVCRAIQVQCGMYCCKTASMIAGRISNKDVLP